MMKIRTMVIRTMMRTPLEPLDTTMVRGTRVTQTGGMTGNKPRTKPLSAIGAIKEDLSSSDTP